MEKIMGYLLPPLFCFLEERYMSNANRGIDHDAQMTVGEVSAKLPNPMMNGWYMSVACATKAIVRR